MSNSIIVTMLFKVAYKFYEKGKSYGQTESNQGKLKTYLRPVPSMLFSN